MLVDPQRPNSRRLEPLSTSTLATRVRDRLYEAIRIGTFGDTLPGEHELAKQLGVSRPTVRTALRSLEEEGIVFRQRGIGTRVNTSVTSIRMNLDRVVGFWTLIEEANHTPSIAYTKLLRIAASLEIADRMGIAEGDEILVIERLFLADGEPAIAVSEMVLASRLLQSVEADEIPEAIFDFAPIYLGERIEYTIVEIQPDISDKESGDLLGLRVGTPLLRLYEAHYSGAEEPIMLSEIRVVDRFVRFNIVRRRRDL